jgi:dolichol-phosphate mannosyltransferase
VNAPAGERSLAVVIPTYDEVENLAWIVRRVRAAVPEADVWIFDDSSPDGTGEVADELAVRDPHVRVVHRAAKAGLGAAYLAAFPTVRAHGDALIAQMDADGSHLPEQLPALVAATEDADVVLGSRWVPGGSVVNWPWFRQALSRGGNLYTRLLLGIPVRDATGGFRVFRREALERIDLTGVQSVGYCFQVDMAWRAVQAGLRVRELPIRFVERVRGESKMSPDVAAESLRRITRWGLRERRHQLARARQARRTR